MPARTTVTFGSFLYRSISRHANVRCGSNAVIRTARPTTVRIESIDCPWWPAVDAHRIWRQKIPQAEELSLVRASPR